MSHTPIDPIPVGLRSQPQDVFDTAMAGFMTQLPTTIDQMNTANAEADASAISATASKNSATASQVAALASQNAAAASASTATSAPGTNATSTTSLAVGVGNKSFTIQTGKLYVPGNYVTIASTASPDNLMSGNITAHNSATGAITVNVSNFKGSGTFAAWTIALAGAPGLTGIVNEQKGSDIASASTINLDAANGNFLHITGGTTITAVTLASGAEREVVFDGALTLTNGASLILPGGINYITAPGDRARFRGDGSAVRVTIQQAGGVFMVREEQPSSTAGGTSVSGANDRILNTVVANTMPGASLASNQVTLPAGTFECDIAATAYSPGPSKLVLYNVTDSSNTAVGLAAEWAASSDAATLKGRFTITSPKVFSIRHYIASGQAATGLGRAGSFGPPEVYTVAIFKKVI